MFRDTKAFSSFSVNDIATAKEFYGEKLGLTVKDGDMGTLVLSLASGADIFVYPKGDGHQPASFTVLNFSVDDINAAVDALQQKGISFENYDTEQMKTDDKGIYRGSAEGNGPDIAWFKDPAGNIIAVMQEKQ